MNTLPTMFGSGAAAAICLGSLVFLLIYLAGFVLFPRWGRTYEQMAVIQRHLVPGLTAALAATGVGLWLHAANVATASADGQTGAATPTSRQELLSSATTKLLPVQMFEDQTLVFPNRQ